MLTYDQHIENMNYYSDSRVQAGLRGEQRFVLYTDDENGCYETELPTRWVVCWTCQGQGKHVNPAIDAGGINPEDFCEDPDFAADYRRGTYDVPCAECDGRTTVREVDEAQLSPEHLEAWDEQCQRENASRREQLAELRMGA